MAIKGSTRFGITEPEPESQSPILEMEEKKHSCCFGKSRWCYFLGILIVIIILGGVIYYSGIIPTRFLPRFTGSYQAVFLTNGQVYFGKLYKENSRYPTLLDVYYLQVTQPPQPIQAGETPPTNINLVKLGGELHGPQDEMRISKSQILFIEDLKSDSRVLEAIKQLQAAK